MRWAAGDGAAGGQAPLAAGTGPGPAVLERVRAALLDQLGGTLPVLRQRAVPAGRLPRRTYAALLHARGPGHPLTCMACGMEDPPPEMTCRPGIDHYAGLGYGCPARRRVRPPSLPGDAG